MFPPATVCKPYPIIFLHLLAILLAGSQDRGGRTPPKKQKQKKKQSNSADLFSCTVIGKMFLSKDSALTLVAASSPFKAKLK